MTYSWFNKTLNKAFYWEDKDLLNHQRQEGNDCINIESDVLITKKQMRKGPSNALIKRVTKNCTQKIIVIASVEESATAASLINRLKDKGADVIVLDNKKSLSDIIDEDIDFPIKNYHKEIRTLAIPMDVMINIPSSPLESLQKNHKNYKKRK